MNIRPLIIHLRRLDWTLIICASLLVIMGIVSIYSSSISKKDFLNFKKQIIFSVFGVLLMLAVSFLDWRFLREDPYIVFVFYFICLVLLVSLFVFAPTIRGARAWYKVGPISLDPIEPTKLILIILLAKYFSTKHIEMYRIIPILVSGFYVFLPSFLIFLQPDLGSVLVLAGLWVGILIVSGIKLRHFMALVLCGILILVFSWSSVLKDYQKERIMNFVRPQISDSLKVGWSQSQAKIAIGSGGIWGQGITKGSQTQYGFLPEPQTDFIFAAIAEEMGLAGIGIMLSLFFILIRRILKIAFDNKSNFPRLFAAGFAVLLLSQIFIHIGMNIGILPIIGIPLPLVSYGGSGLMTVFTGLGVLQSVKISG